MTNDRFNECLDIIGWTDTCVIAEKLQTSSRVVRRWVSGQNTVPEPIGAYLEMVARFIAGNPPPPPPVRTDAVGFVDLDV